MAIAGIVALILFMAALKEIIPLIARILDSILLAVIRVPFRLITRLLARIFAAREQTPYQRGLRRASLGAFIIAACLSASAWFPLLLGQSLGDLAQGLWSSPADHIGVVVWFVAAALDHYGVPPSARR
jgi:hypothetical protein